MKYALGIGIIAVAIVVVISTASDVSSYVTFQEAKVIAQNGKDADIHVVGELKKDDNGEVVGIEKSDDLLSFSFVMVDANGMEQKVYYNEPMPQDFIKSEQVVIIGSYVDQYFVADQILLKCPSKYQEETIEV
jgi:cytochrome c-type biogenesis protein CcmE